MGIVVLWGINTHKCESCGVRGEWPPNADPPTAAQLEKCPKCGVGPFVPLTPEERKAEWDKSSFNTSNPSKEPQS